MSTKRSILITGASGEVGNELIQTLSQDSATHIITLDLRPFSNKNSHLIDEQITGNILDNNLIDQINVEFEIEEIYHLAAILSTKAEQSPKIAHDINVNGTINLLELAVNQSVSNDQIIKFFFPSSIAVYGVHDKEIKTENESLFPCTMYGCNKLYIEKLGVYYSKYYEQLSKNRACIDFRSIRFPGLISASTIPMGGTSDFIPEMWHLLKNENQYQSFVNENTRIPFLAMPDAVYAIKKLMNVDMNKISSRIYNVTSFNPSVREFFDILNSYFKNKTLSFNIDESRQKIVDSWPSDIDDSTARIEWGWEPRFSLEQTIHDYLIPSINQ